MPIKVNEFILSRFIFPNVLMPESAVDPVATCESGRWLASLGVLTEAVCCKRAWGSGIIQIFQTQLLLLPLAVSLSFLICNMGLKTQ